MSDWDGIKVTLLGTGIPAPSINAFGTATLIEAGGLTLMFDCGRGAVIRLDQVGVAIGQVDALFMSHFHSDHYAGLLDFMLTGAIPHWFGGRKGPLDVYGPVGVADVTEGLWQASKPDRDIRIADSEIDPEDMRLLPHQYEEGIVFEQNGVTVRAILVDHGDFVKPAYAFRVDYNGFSFVHSHDTRFNENLIAQSQGVDVLVHEVAAAQPDVIASSHAIRTVLNHHITPDRLGEVFARTNPRMGLLTHIVRLGANRPEIHEITDEIGLHYHGPLIVAEDLMVIRIERAISVIPFRYGSK